MARGSTALRCGGRRRKNLYNYACDALAEYAKLAGGTPREVDDASTAERTTVIDADYDNAVIGGVGDS